MKEKDSKWQGRKKIHIILGLIFIVALISICIRYEETGVIGKIQKKMPIYSVATKDKKIAITFDVNWGKDNTEEILDILDKYNIKATFFVIGGWAEDYPDLVKKIFVKGHEIGNHSNTHPIMTKLSKERIKLEISACDAKIMEITGEGSKLFRCPSGEYNDLVIQTVEEMKMYCIQWDADSIDWMERSADEEYKRIVDKAKPGSILLFHNNAKYTPDNLRRIIEKLQNERYTFVKVGDLIYKGKCYLDYSGKQIVSE